MATPPPDSAWFRDHFNDDYLVLYSGRDAAQAEREVEFVIERLPVRPGDRVLDLCCGFGRHLEAFWRRGIEAVGVDLSSSLLRVARERLPLGLVQADMRRLPFAGGELGFSVLTSFFTSFGYFDSDEENGAAAREIARVLEPGGRFSMDLMNPPSTIRGLVARSERRAGRFEIREERHYDAERRRVEKRIFLRDLEEEAERSYFESVRAYSEEEIRALLERAGLVVTSLWGEFDGSALQESSPRMVVLGHRRTNV